MRHDLFPYIIAVIVPLSGWFLLGSYCLYSFPLPPKGDKDDPEWMYVCTAVFFCVCAPATSIIWSWECGRQSSLLFSRAYFDPDPNGLALTPLSISTQGQ